MPQTIYASVVKDAVFCAGLAACFVGISFNHCCKFLWYAWALDRNVSSVFLFTFSPPLSWFVESPLDLPMGVVGDFNRPPPPMGDGSAVFFPPKREDVGSGL